MDTTMETEEYRGCTVRISGEEYSGDVNPREWTNICTLAAVSDYERYDRNDASHLADKNAPQIVRSWNEPDKFAIDCETCEATGKTGRFKVGLHAQAIGLRTFDSEDEASAFIGTLDNHLDGIYYIDEEPCPDCDQGERYVGLIEYAKRELGAVAAVPVRYSDYGSSGSTVHTTDNEDDANMIALVLPSNVEECGHPLNEDGSTMLWEAAIEQELRIFNQWLAGEVYYWTAEDEDGGIIESVGGYIGMEEFDHMKSEARAAIDAMLDEREAEAQKVAYWNARDVETVG